MRTDTKRLYAEVNLSTFRENLIRISEKLPEGTGILHVSKADAYGHGSVRIALAAEALPFVWGHGVATAQEAIALREAGIEKPVLLLQACFAEDMEELVKHHVRLTCFQPAHLEELSAAAARTGEDAILHIAVDTGMSRIGVQPDETGAAFTETAVQMPGIRVEGIFSHLARADEEDESFTRTQLQRYADFLSCLEERNVFAGKERPLRHILNSAGSLRYPEAAYDLVREGILSYGLMPSDYFSRETTKVRPVLSLHSRVIFVKTVPAGTPVSYGGTYVTERETRIATIPVGYADGYPRDLSGKAEVLIRGKRARILGRICMDQFMADVTDIPGVTEKDEVILIGRDGEEEITMEELADRSGMLNYELSCHMRGRVPRTYI